MLTSVAEFSNKDKKDFVDKLFTAAIDQVYLLLNIYLWDIIVSHDCYCVTRVFSISDLAHCPSDSWLSKAKVRIFLLMTNC